MATSVRIALTRLAAGDPNSLARRRTLDQTKDTYDDDLSLP
jgi:hypothetical protein